MPKIDLFSVEFLLTFWFHFFVLFQRNMFSIAGGSFLFSVLFLMVLQVFLSLFAQQRRDIMKHETEFLFFLFY